MVELATQRTLSFEAFVKAVAQAQVVAVGEEHYHPDIQAFALRLFQALVQHRPQHIALAMEFLERDMQLAVDTYLSGNSDAVTLQTQIKAPPDFMQFYFPLVQYARQAGVPLLALNVPRSLARLSPKKDSRRSRRLYSPLSGPIWLQLFYLLRPVPHVFLQAVAAAHPLSEEQRDRFVEAAHLKDDTMAESLAAFLERAADMTVLAIAGRFHFDYGLAIPVLLRQRRPRVTMQRVTTMAIAADDIIDLRDLAREALADYVWFAPPRPETKVEN